MVDGQDPTAPSGLSATGPEPLVSRRAAVAVACASALAFLLTYDAFVGTHRGQALDLAVWRLVLQRPASVRLLPSDLARYVLPWLLGAAVLVMFLRARVGQRWVSLVTLAAVPMAYGLRGRLGRPDLGIGDVMSATFPSTHAAAGLALLAGLAVLGPWPVPRVTRWLLVVGAVLVAIGNVSWYAHRPSDVLGSAFLVVAMLALGYATRPSPRR